MRGAAVLLLASSLVHAAPASPWSEKPYGVLLVGPDGGTDWELFVSQVRKALGKNVPAEAFAGPLEPRGLQAALDRLKAARARKVVVLPVTLHASSPDVEQLRYILGLEKLPSKRFMQDWGMTHQLVPRAKTKAAVVVGEPLGDDASVCDALVARAKEHARLGKPETVLLLGNGSALDDENAAWDKDAEAIAARLDRAPGLGGARAWLLRPSSREKPLLGAESEKGLVDLARTLARQGRVVVVPYLLTQDGSSRQWKKVLDNPFLRWQDKGLLPSERVARWAVERAAALSREPDQVRFKDAGLELPETLLFKNR